jgi:hypothetical protein
MSHTDRLLKRPRHFRRLTGLTPAAFRVLLAELGPAWDAAEVRRKARRPRRRKPGAGPKFALPLADMLLALLIYYRTYVPYSFLGVLFGIDDSTVCRNNRRIEPLLAGIFRIPEKKVRLSADEVREVFFDTTERPIPRPTRGQRAYYSGKKKRHTVKHQVVVVRVKKPAGRRRTRQRLRIKAVSPAHPGPTADKVIYDRGRVRVPAGATGYGDLAYLGTTLTTPYKRPRGGTLSPRRKAGNRRRGRKRIAVEHGIGKMKVWRIAAERWRNPRRRHTLMFKNVAGLHNRMFG